MSRGGGAAGVEGRGWKQRFSTCPVSFTPSLCAEEQNQGWLFAAFHLAISKQIGPANVYRPQIFLLAVSFAVSWEEVGRRKEERGGMKGEMTHFTSLSHSTVNVFHGNWGTVICNYHSRSGSHCSSFPISLHLLSLKPFWLSHSDIFLLSTGTSARLFFLPLFTAYTVICLSRCLPQDLPVM